MGIPASYGPPGMDGLSMNVRIWPQHVCVASLTVVAGLAFAVAALTTGAGFSPLVAVGVGLLTGLIGCWALASEP